MSERASSHSRKGKSAGVRAVRVDDARAERLREFTAWCDEHIDGDEKGEAQVFLDRLFQAFGQRGVKEAGATLEMRVKNDTSGTSFADLVWKPVVLIEMKRRGEDLSRHLLQAFDYWVRLVPDRPRYVVLCNFDEFRVYDFNIDINEPQDVVTLAELPERYGPLQFLFPTREAPVFRVDRLRVTREAADLLAAVYKRVKSRREVRPETAQRFILQILIALFSEDINLLPKYFVTQLLDECVDPPKAFDLFNGLFEAMNNADGARGGRYKDVPNFNGGIFSESAAVELDPENEVALLKRASEYNWAHISPDIFGTIFQHSMEAGERHAFGAHYTAPEDILKIVRPTIVEPFIEAIGRAETLKEIAEVRHRLQTLRVLDPACGSGNFLYIAYREMRRLEAEINRVEVERRGMKGQEALGGVSPRQFFGMDVLPFAVELAKVTLALAPKLSSDELHTTERTLPLQNLDTNILCVDALLDWPLDGSTPRDHDPARVRARTEWPAADVIIGNPPFLGAKRLKPERGSDYVNAVRKAYPDVPGMADYCVYWFRRAHDHLPECSAADPFRGRAGLVGTQNVRNNKSREGGLDHVAASGVIVEAVENQPWSGEANVHVSIANWVKSREAATATGKGRARLERALLIPAKRRLWSKVEATPPLFDNDDSDAGTRRVVKGGRRNGSRKDKTYELALREAAAINSALTDEVALSNAASLQCNTDPQRSFQGVNQGYNGFMVTLKQRAAWIAIDRKHKEVVRPLLIGRDVVSGDGRPSRATIDFGALTMLQARAYGEPFQYVKDRVLPEVRKTAAKTSRGDMGAARADHLERWWQYWNVRRDMRNAFRSLQRYIACSRVTKRPIFVFISTGICPDGALQVFAFDDDYSFGVLQSDAHWRWFMANCSKLTERFRYTRRSVWDTFPWPQSPTRKHVRAVAEAGREVRRVRGAAMEKSTGGLRALYRTLELPGKNALKDAHAALDAAVMGAYGFAADRGVLEQLLALNGAVAARIAAGEDVTAPGVPAGYGEAGDLVTGDCVGA